jgi:EAL domain-containing protein (putative c-di-GMP-specific phosphodiesterase class I)/GGDEF domain-containing protein
MAFLNSITLNDMFLVAIGLALASFIRILYDSYRGRMRLKKMDKMVKVYSESMDVYEEGILIISDKDEVVFSNKEASRVLVTKNAEVTTAYLKKKVSIRLSGAIKEENFWDTIQKRKNIPHAYIVVENASVPVSVNTNKFHMGFSQDVSWRIVILQDITSNLKLQEQVESVGSYKDLLTGLPTRHHLSSDLVPIVLKATQNDYRSAISLLGIKGYTALQAMHGIEKIDLLLRGIARDISSILEENETLYRFECDTFAIVSEKIPDEEEARRRVDSLIAKMQNILAGENIEAIMMQGLYFIGQSEATVEKILNESYRVLRGKSSEGTSGANVNFGRRSTDRGGGRYLASKLTKEDFLAAVRDRDFFFFYQPIYDLRENRVAGIEVLTRLNHREYGFLLANDFLGKAIEYGVMPEITRHLLDRVLGQKKFWQTERGADLDMTINLTLSDLQSGTFAEMLEDKLSQYEIDPATITIDMPEVVLTEDFESVMEEFYMFKKIGVKLTIDHFGKEYINLKHVERLPLDAIKIDGSIIQSMAEDEHKTRLVSSIISMGKGLGLRIGANHVDSEEIRATLEELGCDFAQGYHFGKAVPAFEITDIIKNPL